MTSCEPELPEAIAALLALVGFDHVLAGHVAVALHAYRGRLAGCDALSQNRALIVRFDELIDAARFLADKGGQALGGRDLLPHDRHGYLLGSATVARLLGVCERTLRRRAKAKEIDTVRCGGVWFTREAVLAYVVRNSIADRSGS